MNEYPVPHVLFPLHDRLRRKLTFRWFGEPELRAQFAAVLTSDMRITIERTTSLPRTASCKFRHVESRVAKAVLDRFMTPTHTKEHLRDDR